MDNLAFLINLINAVRPKPDTKLNTNVIVDKGNYNVFKRKDGTYYYKKDNKEINITDPKTVHSLKANNYVSLILPDATAKKKTTPVAPKAKAVSYSPTPTAKKSVAPTVSPNTGVAKVAEAAKPRTWSAAELADLYGIDYNEARILSDYNNATDTYYTGALNEQEGIRDDYARNNAMYTNNIVQDYLKGYTNAAPTAVGQGTIAANALSAQLSADQLNAGNDYGMLDVINTYKKAHKAELAGNPDLARQYYNQIGTYLSTVGAEKNKSDVEQYIQSLDAYGKKYSADRDRMGYEAQGAAAKYSGLARAAGTNAQAAAAKAYNPTSEYDALYNYYLNVYGGNSKDAYNATTNLIKSGVGG